MTSSEVEQHPYRSPYVDLDYELRRRAWYDEWCRRTGRYVDRMIQEYDDAEAKARRLSGVARREACSPDNSPAAFRRAQRASRKAAESWAAVRLLEVPHDALGAPIDPRPAGRLKFERAHTVRTGMPWGHPDDDDTPPEHRAGEHPNPDPRSFHGHLLACGGCMQDDEWTVGWACRLELKARNGRPMSALQRAWLASDPLSAGQKAWLSGSPIRQTP